MARPERLVVGHPFNPVYLLPLVEVCGGDATSPETIERATAAYRSVGMQPLHVRTEIDGFVADRLLEALWREALWLVQRRRRDRGGDRRRDPLRRGPALGVHGHVPHVPHRRRRRRHAPLHGAVRARAAVAVDEAHGCAGADGRAARPGRRAVRRAGGRALDPRARARARRRARCDPAGAARHRRQARGDAARVGARAARRRRRPGRSTCRRRGSTTTVTCTRAGTCRRSRMRRMRCSGRSGSIRPAGSYFTVETHLRHLRHAARRRGVPRDDGGSRRRREAAAPLARALRPWQPTPVATAEQTLVHVDVASGRAAPVGQAVRERIEQASR